LLQEIQFELNISPTWHVSEAAEQFPSLFGEFPSSQRSQIVPSALQDEQLGVKHFEQEISVTPSAKNPAIQAHVKSSNSTLF
jgi:hypothetical protein